MIINLNTCSIVSPAATEIYISASPTEDAPLQDQAREIFSGIREILCSKKAFILQERVFATQEAMETLYQTRSQAYGKLNDGVDPSFLVAKEGLSGQIAGVQVHAISSNSRPEVIELEGNLCGRILRLPGHTCITLSCISDQQYRQVTAQAMAIMEKAEVVLKRFGVNFLSVPRIWVWLKDILLWYDQFNDVRNKFFTERGLIGPGTCQSMPASTGIGLGPANGSNCAMDLIAVLDPADCIEYFQATGKQRCALEYGSAFSRSTRSVLPAGRTIFISGTASIDNDGATTHIGDASGQINTTIENVLAVLRDMHCENEDVVQVVAYCKTAEVEEIFNAHKDCLPWPWMTIICDICRSNLLFEIEATAVPKQTAKDLHNYYMK
jgi:enamine deaminase RidA (YjgF/YER057c/UK114 family)